MSDRRTEPPPLQFDPESAAREERIRQRQAARQARARTSAPGGARTSAPGGARASAPGGARASAPGGANGPARATARRHAPPRRRPWADLPLWLRWVVSMTVAAAAVVLLVRYINHNNVDTPTFSSPAAAVKANQEAAILIRQDQAPHTARIAHGASPAAAMTAAVAADMNSLILHNVIDGPLQHTACRQIGGSSTRQAFHCVAMANDVNYPFYGVADTTAARLTFCKSDPPPIPSMRIPISSRCR